MPAPSGPSDVPDPRHVSQTPIASIAISTIRPRGIPRSSAILDKSASVRGERVNVRKGRDVAPHRAMVRPRAGARSLDAPIKRPGRAARDAR